MMKQFIVWELRGVRYLCLRVEGEVILQQVKRI